MGDAIFQEASWILQDRLGASHALDLHWRSSSSPVLSQLLGYEDMLAGAINVPALGPAAMTPRPVHALLFACIHRAGHVNAPLYLDGVPHPAKERLIWLYDIHLMARAMTRGEVREAVEIALCKRMAVIFREALAACSGSLGLNVPPYLMDELSRGGEDEPSARVFRGGRLRQMVGDWLALEGAGERGRWLRELVFPSEKYMRWKYARARNFWLPYLYARRAVEGLWKLGGHSRRRIMESSISWERGRG